MKIIKEKGNTPTNKPITAALWTVYEWCEKFRFKFPWILCRDKSTIRSSREELKAKIDEKVIGMINKTKKTEEMYRNNFVGIQKIK